MAHAPLQKSTIATIRQFVSLQTTFDMQQQTNSELLTETPATLEADQTHNQTNQN
jgi:hypothetical protein